MLGDVFDLLFGCTHRRYTFPITAKPGQPRTGAAALTGTYVACLDCGKEFPYDWKLMKVVTPAASAAAAARTADRTATVDLKAA